MAREAAFELLEGRYLDGRGVLFRETRERWERLRRAAEGVVWLGGRPDRLVRICGARVPLDLDALRAEARAEAPPEAERLLETVRARALDSIGDTADALAIAARPFREVARGS